MVTFTRTNAEVGFLYRLENRIPYDFHEVMAFVPRPLLVIAPLFDKDANHEDVIKSVDESKKIYDLYNTSANIEIFSPNDINKLSPEIREKNV